MSELFNYCLYYRNEKINVGFVQNIQKNKLQVLNEKGSKVQINLNQCEFTWKAKSYESTPDILKYIEEFSEQVEKQSQNFDIASVHELCTEGEAMSLKDICSFFLDSPWKIEEEVALFLALKTNPFYFRNKKELYFPRGKDEIERLEKEKLRKEEALQKEKVEKNWADIIYQNQHPEIPDKDATQYQQFKTRTYNFAIYLKRHPESSYLANIWKLNLNDEYNARYTLSRVLHFWGYSVSWGNLLTKSLEHCKPHSENVLKEMEELTKNYQKENLLHGNTTDETHLDVFSIDSKETKDYDDAISFNPTPNGLCIRLHITDVASFIGIQSYLFELARSRMSTLYTLKKNFNMLPEELSTDAFSLRKDTVRAVMTFQWEVNEQSEILNTKVYRSIIHCKNNFTYEEFDEFLNDENSSYQPLKRFAEYQQNIRIKKGALVTTRKDVKLNIEDPENIQARFIDQNTPSNQLVSELAIQANAHAAKICQDYGLPGIFRAQEPYTLTREFPPNTPVDMNFVIIKAAQITDKPAPHSGLGLDAYLQITSPIRRFPDIVSQHILFSWIQEKTISFPTNMLLMWSKNYEEINKVNNQIEKELFLHWKLKYLLQNKDRLFDASFVRYLKTGSALISIEEIQIFKELDYNQFYEGCTFQVKITDVDISLHHFQIELMEESINKQENEI